MNDKAKPINWRRSEEIPKRWDKQPVKVLVGKNFDEVLEKTKFAFVMFYLPYCGDCKNMLSLWKQLGEMFKDNREIIIAKIDADANEIESMVEDKLARFPAFFLYKQTYGNRIKFEKKQTLEEFLNFLQSHDVKVEGERTEKDEL